MTPAQLQTLRNAIDANPVWAAYPNNGDGWFDLALVLNQPANPTFTVWRTDTPVSSIIDAISFAGYTPNDAVSSSDTDPVLSRKIGWLLTIQTKQMNLQLMLQGRDRLNTSPPNVRSGLRDAVIQIPSGAGGANSAPGGVGGTTVLNACTRAATEAEKILAAASQASDTTGTVTARVMTWEGTVSPQQVQAARELP